MRFNYTLAHRILRQCSISTELFLAHPTLGLVLAVLRLLLHELGNPTHGEHLGLHGVDPLPILIVLFGEHLVNDVVELGLALLLHLLDLFLCKNRILLDHIVENF